MDEDLLSKVLMAVLRVDMLHYQALSEKKFRSRESCEMKELDIEWNKAERISRRWTATTCVLPTGDSFPSSKCANELHFDHLYISFSELLFLNWHAIFPLFLVILFGGPNSSGLLGILKMKIVEWLGRETKNSPEVAERKLADLILGTTLITWISEIWGESGNLKGHLLIPQATHLLLDKTVTAGDLRIIIDISKS